MSEEKSQKTEEKALAVIEEKPSVPIVAGGIQIQSFEALQRFATMVAASGLAPKGMEKMESCAIAIEMGLEVGLRPMQALQNIAVVNGRPSIWGDAALALVKASGLLEDHDETWEGKPYEDTFQAVVMVKRYGQSRSAVRTFSVADAKAAGLWKKGGPWTQYPKRMLQMRARAFALRDVFPDVLKGLAIGEEVQDYIDVHAAPVEAPKGLHEVTRRMEARQVSKGAEKAQEPVEDDEAPFEVDEDTGEILESETPAEEESGSEPAGVGAIDEESLF